MRVGAVHAEGTCVVCDQYRRTHPSYFTPDRKQAIRQLTAGIAGIATSAILLGLCWYIATGLVDVVQWIGH